MQYQYCGVRVNHLELSFYTQSQRLQHAQTIVLSHCCKNRLCQHREWGTRVFLMKTNLFMTFREWRLYSDGSVLITPEWPRRRYLTFTDHGFGLLFDRGQDQVHSIVSHATYLGQMFFPPPYCAFALW